MSCTFLDAGDTALIKLKSLLPWSSRSSGRDRNSKQKDKYLVYEVAISSKKENKSGQRNEKVFFLNCGIYSNPVFNFNAPLYLSKPECSASVIFLYNLA